MQYHSHRLDLTIFEFALDVSITMDFGVSILDFVLCFRMQIFHRPCVIHLCMGYALDCSFNMIFLNTPCSQQVIRS